jgi:hypothetical protein
MKNLKSNIIIIALLSIIFVLLFKSCGQRDALSRSISAVTVKDSIITRVTDELGRETAKAKARQFTINDLKNSNTAEVAELKKEIGRLNKKFKNYTRVKITTTDTIKTILKDTFLHIRRDTIRGDTVIIAKRFDYKDKWLSLEGIAFNDSLICQYYLKNDLSITHKLGGGFFKRDNNLYVTIKNNNPNTTTNQVQTFKIKERKRYPIVTFITGAAAGFIAGFVATRNR